MEVLKKGFEDAFFVIVVVLTIAIFLLILGKAWGEMRNPIENSLNQSVGNDDFNFTSTFDKVDTTLTLFDTLLPFIILGLFAFVFITAGALFKHPMMIFVGIIVLGVALLLGMIYSNIYESISESSNFDDVNNTFSDLYMK